MTETVDIQRVIEGRETIDKMNFIVGNKAFLVDSNLLTMDLPIADTDVRSLKTFFSAIFPRDAENERFLDHLYLTEKFARELTFSLSSVNPVVHGGINIHEVAILALLHDAGRFITHRHMRTDIIGEQLVQRLGIREDIRRKLPSSAAYLSHLKEKKTSRDIINKTVIEQKIVELADWLGKPIYDQNGNLTDIKTFEQVLHYHYDSRLNVETNMQRRKIWPSEETVTPEYLELVEQSMRQIRDDFIAQGVDIEQIRERISRSLTQHHIQ